MNQARRKQLDEIIGKAQILIEKLEAIKEEEEEYRDNMPENLQGTEKYEKSESACDSMQEAIDYLEDVVTAIESAQE